MLMLIRGKNRESSGQYYIGPGFFFAFFQAAPDLNYSVLGDVKMRKKIQACFALFILSSPSMAFAEMETELVESKPVTELTLDEVVVTATKTAQKRKDVPNTVILKDALDLEDAPARGLGELLANESGLDWRTYGNYGGAAQEIHIRGMGGDATQIFLNGININSPSLGSADLGRLPINSIEKIEVVKGAGSLLYGTGAMGGTVHLLSKNPQHDQVILKGKAGYGTEETYELSAEHGMFVTDTLGYYLTATKRETDGFRDNSALDHTDLSMKLLFDMPEHLQASIFSTYIDRDYGVPGVKPPEGTPTHIVNGTAFYNENSASLVNKGGNDDWHNALELTASPLDSLGLTMRAEYSDTENYNLTRRNSSGTGTETWVTNTTSGIEGFAEWHPFTMATLVVGGQYRDYDSENKQEDLDSFGASVAGSRSTTENGIYTRGGYIEAQYRPGKYVKMLTGMRHEYHSTSGSENIPRFGLVINPCETTVIKLSHGKHFRAPSINDLFWPDSGFAKGNTNLIAESGWHSDVTMEQSLWQDKVMAILTFFQADIDDKIDWAEDPTDPNIYGGGYWKPSNVDKFESQGVELSLTLTPVDPLRISLSYTYLDAQEEKVAGTWRQATDTAKNTFKADFAYHFSFGLSTNMVVRYVDERPSVYATDADTKAEHVLDSYVTTDIKISQSLGEHWLFALTATNLFDKGYDVNSSDFYGTTSIPNCGYPGAERSFFGTVTYEF